MKKSLKWMVRVALVLIVVVPVILIVFLEYRVPFTNAEFDAGLPENTQIIWTDFDAFWQAVDESKQPDGTYDKAIFDTVYPENRTDGLKKFDMLRYGGSGAVWDSYRFIPFYQSFRDDLTKDAFDKNAIVKVFEKVRTYYPDAPIPNVRVFMGIANNGGTITQGDIIIAYEMFALNTDADWNKLDVNPEFKNWLQNFVYAPNTTDTTAIIAHEYIHYLQASRMNIISRNLMKIKMLRGKSTLLEMAFQEGVANFLQSLLTNTPPTHKNIQTYVDNNGGNDKFMAEFIQLKDATDPTVIGDWLYSTNTSDGRPFDMGYWAGAIIAEKYWNKMTDKKQAFMDLIGDKPVEEIFTIAMQ